MKKTNIETKSYTEKRKIKTREKIICDVCGCVIYDTDQDQEQKGIKFYRTTMYHSEWGNNSIDSFEYDDICSGPCLLSKVTEYAKDAEGNYPSMELEIEYKEVSPKSLGIGKPI